MKKINSILKFLIIMIMLYGNSSCSQQDNRVSSGSIGVSFVIPDGWVGQETQAGYMLKSNTMAGFVLINKNNTSDINTMFYEAQQGFVNNDSNYLQLVGNVENFNNTGVGAEYNGVMEGVPAKGYMVGVLNNMGLGVSIMAVTTSEYYSNAYRQLCIDIASSVSSPQSTEINQVTKVNQPVRIARKVNKTEELFGGARLSYFNSGDGYGTKITIDLCEQGFFHHSSYDSVAVSGGDYSGGYGDNSSGAGIWSVIENTNQHPILRLKFHNGKILEYYITFDGKKTYLDNRRYFRVYGEDGARWCN
jgi:hypothetical protein